MKKILECRIMFMCKPHVLLWKWVWHMKIKFAFETRCLLTVIMLYIQI